MTIFLIAQFTFFASFALITYTYLGYPCIIFLLSRLCRRNVNKAENTPHLSIVISVYNEEKNIERKIRETIALDYPADRVEIVVGSDGSNDRTNEIVRRINDPRVKLFVFPERRGKVNVLNQLIAHARGEIIVFADARQKYCDTALKELAANFHDASVGCVSGELILTDDEVCHIGKGLNTYWNYEKVIRKSESLVYSGVGATGAIYAIRKSLYSAPDGDILLDDVYIPLGVVSRGYRVVFDPSAIAYDKMVVSPEQESKRKMRTLAGNWQLMFRLKGLSISLFSVVGWELLSHKFLRLMIPYLLVVLFISNVLLLQSSLFLSAMVFQFIFYICALLGYFLAEKKIRIFNVPYTFCLLNFLVVRSLADYVQGRQQVTWNK